MLLGPLRTPSLLCLVFSGACFLGRLRRIPAADSQRLIVNLDSRVWRWCPIPWQAESWTWSCSVLPSEPGSCPLVHLPFLVLLGMACLWHYRPGVWRCLDKILPTSLWPSPNWLIMSTCFKPDHRSPIICHLTYMLMGWHLFGGILTINVEENSRCAMFKVFATSNWQTDILGGDMLPWIIVIFSVCNEP